MVKLRFNVPAPVACVVKLLVNVTVDGVKELLLIANPAAPAFAKALSTMVTAPALVLPVLPFALKPLIDIEVMVPAAVVLVAFTSVIEMGAS